MPSESMPLYGTEYPDEEKSATENHFFRTKDPIAADDNQNQSRNPDRSRILGKLQNTSDHANDQFPRINRSQTGTVTERLFMGQYSF